MTGRSCERRPAWSLARLLPAVLALAALLVVAAGCGKTTVVREPAIAVKGGAAPVRAPGGPVRVSGAVTIAVVTHGQASSPFWAIVRNGVEAAARQMDVLVSYRARRTSTASPA